MKESFVLFYSWQSDVDETKKLVTKCLDKAVKEVSAKLKKSVNIDLRLDRDTKGESGTPAITETILQKVSNCDIFLADVTIINSALVNSHKLKPTSNPNVLFELGYAVRHLGWERIICLNDNTVNSVEQLPFDIRARRISGFEDRNEEKLKNLLVVAITAIIDNYDRILEKIKVNDKRKHDLAIFAAINELYSEARLKDVLEWVVSSLHITDLQYSQWEALQRYYKSTLNHFMDEETHNCFKEFLVELDSFKWMCMQNLKVRKEQGETLYEAKQSGREITEDLKWNLLQNVSYSPYKNPYANTNETWEEADRRVLGYQRNMGVQVDKVYESYTKFIHAYKNNILI